MTETISTAHSIAMSIPTARPACAANAVNVICAHPAHGARPLAICARTVSVAHQKIFDTALWYDYIFGFITAQLFLSVIAAVPDHFGQ